MAFHEVRLPARLAFGSTGGVERRTEITTLASGFERRSTPWALGRRRYLIGANLRSLDDMAELVAFFEARRGRLYGFRFKDFADFKSCAPGGVVSAGAGRGGWDARGVRSGAALGFGAADRLAGQGIGAGRGARAERAAPLGRGQRLGGAARGRGAGTWGEAAVMGGRNVRTAAGLSRGTGWRGAGRCGVQRSPVRGEGRA